MMYWFPEPRLEPPVEKPMGSCPICGSYTDVVYVADGVEVLGCPECVETHCEDIADTPRDTELYDLTIRTCPCGGCNCRSTAPANKVTDFFYMKGDQVVGCKCCTYEVDPLEDCDF